MQWIYSNLVIRKLTCRVGYTACLYFSVTARAKQTNISSVLTVQQISASKFPHCTIVAIYFPPYVLLTHTTFFGLPAAYFKRGAPICSTQTAKHFACCLASLTGNDVHLMRIYTTGGAGQPCRDVHYIYTTRRFSSSVFRNMTSDVNLRKDGAIKNK